MKKRQYTQEFKKEAVARWRNEYRKRGELAFPGHGKENLTPREEENRRLKKELIDITQERDILKKALAIFTKKP